MERAGLRPAVVNDPEARLPHSSVRAFWREAVRETGDQAIGLHVAEQVRPAAFDALGYVFRSAERSVTGWGDSPATTGSWTT